MIETALSKTHAKSYKPFRNGNLGVYNLDIDYW